MLGAIRLAWWRERLEELDCGDPPAEPRLREAKAQLLPRGISGAELAALEGAWLRLFDDFPWGIRVAEAIAFRGRYLFMLGGRILGEVSEQLQQAGGLWALVDAARHCSDAASREMLMGEGLIFAQGLAGARFPSSVRALSVLAALASRDASRGTPFEPGGTPARAAAMLKHRVTGRLPRAG